ncbi:MAG: guanylate kinase [Eubacteriales bacterium]|nr:guanylate kinase [Eubacteriales bacterium]
MKRGNLYVISGPAGAGKSEIVKTVLAKHPDVKVSVSCTTRKPRPGEVEGESYYFVSDEEFDRLVAEDAFYEWAHVHQNRYGTPKAAVQQALAAGVDMILEIDVQGCLQAMEQDSQVTGIFISPPSRENLETRLRNRGTETEESIRVRLGNVANEVAQAYRYNYLIVHQDWNEVPDALNIAAEQVYAIISAKRCETAAQMGFLNELSASLKK